jgi:hypothetical protein
MDIDLPSSLNMNGMASYKSIFMFEQHNNEACYWEKYIQQKNYGYFNAHPKIYSFETKYF